MGTPENLVQLINAESERLTHDLHALPPEAWQHSSACRLWEVRDVVGHLTWLAEFFLDIISRGMQGDASMPAGFPSGDALTAGACNAYIAQKAIAHRQRLGEQLLPTYSTCYTALRRLLSRLTPPDWDKPCANWPSVCTVAVRTVLVQIIQELVLHGWDIRSRLETAAPLSPESLPLLMARILARLRRFGAANFRPNAIFLTPVRYRLELTGAVPGTHDLIVDTGTVRMEPAGTASPHVTFRGETECLVLLMYRRLTLESMLATGQLVVEGDHGLTAAFDQWLKEA
jgi:hypothetical protein